MTKIVGLIAAFMTMSHAAWAADIYVRETVGMNLSGQDAQEVTQAVERSINNMPEHNLAKSEDQADFVLQPSILEQENQTVLRIERIKDGETLSISEQPIARSGATDQLYSSLTEEALGQENMAGDRQIASTPSESEMSEDTQSAATGEDDTLLPRLEPGQGVAGEVRGPSPRIREDQGMGYFQIGLGPSVAIGLDSDNVMTNINVGYNIDFMETLSGKIFGDFNLGSGQDTARFINWGVGADWFPTTQELAIGTPYVTGNLGFAFVRHQNDTTEAGPAIGAGAGFKFQAAELNWDINLNYTLFTDDVEGGNPSILGLRAAVNF